MQSAGGRTPVLEVRGIKKRFGAVEALKGVSFALEEGEILGIVGDNGAGKSTLIKIIAGVHEKDEGQILVYGRPADIRQPKDAKELGIETVYQAGSGGPSAC
jgi:ABC-type sugar transport system ATPase subunit